MQTLWRGSRGVAGLSEEDPSGALGDDEDEQRMSGNEAGVVVLLDQDDNIGMGQSNRRANRHNRFRRNSTTT